MKSAILMIGLISALCLRAGVATTSEAEFTQRSDQDNLETELPYIYELENGPMKTSDVARLSAHYHDQMYSQQTKGFIKFINNAQPADIMDLRGFRTESTCYAQNAGGLVFRVVGSNAQRAQNHATTKCFSYRSVCEPLGCLWKKCFCY